MGRYRLVGLGRLHRCRQFEDAALAESCGLLAFPQVSIDPVDAARHFFRPGCRSASVFVSSGFSPGRAAPAVQDSAVRIRGRGVDVSASALARLTAS